MADENDIALMKSRILENLTKIFSNKVKEFFHKDFDEKLEAIVESKMEIINQSNQHISVLDQNLPNNDHEARLIVLEKQNKQKNERIGNLLKDLRREKEKKFSAD